MFLYEISLVIRRILLSCRGGEVMRFLFLDTKYDAEMIRTIFNTYFNDESCEISHDVMTRKVMRKLILTPFRYDVIFCKIKPEEESKNHILLFFKYLWSKNKKLIFIFIIDTESVHLSVYKVPHIYVAKEPINKYHLNEALERIHYIMRFKNSNSKELLLHWKSNIFPITEQSIMYIRRIKHGIRVITSNKEYMHAEKLEDFIEHLTLSSFVRCAYSCVVNFKFIISIEGSVLEMQNGEFINVTRHYMKSFRKFIQDY